MLLNNDSIISLFLLLWLHENIYRVWEKMFGGCRYAVEQIKKYNAFKNIGM